ncbi:MAG: hypothetical protein J5601_06945 [Elusimicrobiaceae bacterium]|nr:hypothetical protein [Elusimicrobiaceae bacterium]
MRLLQSYFNYMENPDGNWYRLLPNRSFGAACVGYLVAAIGWVVFFNLGDGLSVFSLFTKLFLVFLAEITLGYFIASLTGMLLSFQKVEVPSSDLFALLGSSGFIKIILLIGALVSSCFPQANLGHFAFFLLLVVFGLQFFYLSNTLKQWGNISFGQAFLYWMLGIFPVFVLFGLLSIFALWGIILLF